MRPWNGRLSVAVQRIEVEPPPEVDGIRERGRHLAEAPDDLAVCCGFLDHVRGRDADDAERLALTAALDNVRLREASL